MNMDVSHYAVCCLYYVASLVCEVACSMSEPFSPHSKPPLPLVTLTYLETKKDTPTAAQLTLESVINLFGFCKKRGGSGLGR